MIIKLIVAGGRDFFDEEWMERELYQYCVNNVISADDIELVCGKAKGADSTAETIFLEHGLPVKSFIPNWKDVSNCEPWQIGSNQYGKYNKVAGMHRNHAMGDYATHLLAFWDGRSKGTKDMIDYMYKLGKPVEVVRY